MATAIMSAMVRKTLTRASSKKKVKGALKKLSSSAAAAAAAAATMGWALLLGSRY